MERLCVPPICGGEIVEGIAEIVKEIAEEILELQKKSLKNNPEGKRPRKGVVFDCLRLQPLH